MAYGVTKDQAARGISTGWRKDTLLAMNAALHNREELGEFEGDHIFVIPGHQVVLYRSFSPADVWHAFEDYREDAEVVAYCDGSGNTGDKAAGIGVVVYRPWARPELIAENIHLGTNNRAELCAAWRALRATPWLKQRLLIKTDSQYTIGALTKDWARNANAGLIANIRCDLVMRPNVSFEHVDGHAGHEGNEIADQLANIGRKLVTTITSYEGH